LTTALRSSRFAPLRLVNAPTSACIGHGLDREMEGDERLLLVVDGSDARSDTDLSLLLLEDGVFDVLEVRRVVSPADGSHAAQVSAVVATLLETVSADTLSVTVRRHRTPPVDKATRLD
jgi:hypothetical protein